LKEFKANLQLYVIPDFFNSICNIKYEDILVTLNFLSPHMRRMHVDALFLINAFKRKFFARPFLVSLHILSRSIRDYSAVSVHHSLKTSPSARCISAGPAFCRSIDIFNKDCIFFFFFL
jgi:hypothetical protein